MNSAKRIQSLAKLAPWQGSTPIAIIVAFVALSSRAANAEIKPVAMVLETREQILTRWADVPAARLHETAEAGQADAQYVYAWKEWEAAWQEVDSLNDSLRAGASDGVWPPPAWKAADSVARTNWDGVSQTDIMKAAQAGDRGAYFFLFRQASERSQARSRVAFEWLSKAAAQSFVPAQYSLAMIQLGQTGIRVVPVDVEAGGALLRNAAQAGHLSAQLRLAEMLMQGDVLPPDLPGAIGWLRQAADHGSAQAQFNLARQYAGGNGEPRHAGETPLALFRQAAEAGLADAQLALAERYRTGFGVMQDYFEAAAWYRKAASSTNLAALDRRHNLTRFLSRLVETNVVTNVEDFGDPEFGQAVLLFLKAVSQHQAEAQAAIGDFYTKNRSTENAVAKAYFWYGAAGSQGLQRAVKQRDELKHLLTAEDSQRVSRWTREFSFGTP